MIDCRNPRLRIIEAAGWIIVVEDLCLDMLDIGMKGSRSTVKLWLFLHIPAAN